MAFPWAILLFSSIAYSWPHIDVGNNPFSTSGGIAKRQDTPGTLALAIRRTELPNLHRREIPANLTIFKQGSYWVECEIQLDPLLFLKSIQKQN